MAADVAEGYVTRAAAEATYGIVEGDAEATRVKRAALAAARVRVPLTAAADLEGGRGRAIRLDAATARRLGVTTGAVVELVNPRGAPLRAWVTSIDAARVEIAPLALQMLALADGAEVEIRAVHSGTLMAWSIAEGELWHEQ